MTVNRTTLLDLPLPVTGTESGTWGDTTNNGLTQYLDIAIAGTLVLSTDADVTLTSTEGDSSATNIGATTAQYAILRWTATGSTTRNITALAQSKTYVVINATGGTQSIVLRGAGPTTGVTIISGEKALCVWNGSDFVKVSSSAAAGGSNTQVQYNSSGVLAGSSNMTFDGTSLTLGGNPTLSAGTANGVLYLNGSKVATSGSALTFDGTNLGIGVASPTLRIQAAVSGATTTFDGLNVTNGTAQFRLGTTGASYSYAGAGANETWLYSAGTTPLTLGPDGNAPIKFVTNGSEQMRLTSTGLGIGTSSPGFKLHPYVDSNTTTNIAVFENANTGSGVYSQIRVKGGTRTLTMGLAGSGTSGGAYIGTDQAQALALYTAGGTATLDSSGNLGLGVTPSAWKSTSKAFQIGTTGSIENNNGNGSLYLSFNGYRASSGSYTYVSNNFASLYGLEDAGKFVWYTAPSGTAGNAITFSQVMTLDASGNLLVGITSNSTATQGIQIQPSGASAGAANINVNHIVGTASSAAYMQFVYNGGAIGSITQNGTTGVLYNITSDYRLKNVIGSVTGSGERIDALEPVDYTWKADGSTARGFLAHKFQEVYPNSVTGSKDEIDTEGNPVYQAMQSSSSEVIADLVAEIQSLRQRVALLEGN